MRGTLFISYINDKVEHDVTESHIKDTVCKNRNWSRSHSTHLGCHGELSDDDCNRIGVLGQFPGAGQFNHLFIGISGVRQQGSGFSQTLDQGLNLIEISLLPEELCLLEVTWQCQLWRTQEVENVAEVKGTQMGSVLKAEVFQETWLKQAETEHL